MFYLTLPRHISTLPNSDLTAPKCDFRYTPKTDIACHSGHVRKVPISEQVNTPAGILC
jgi:hypothetical protein